MGKIQIILSSLFKKQVTAQIEWYVLNRGNKFAKTFRENVNATVLLLTKHPSAGQLIKESKGRTYRSFLAHPKCRIEYWYNENSITILRLKFNSMSN